MSSTSRSTWNEPAGVRCGSGRFIVGSALCMSRIVGGQAGSWGEFRQCSTGIDRGFTSNFVTSSVKSSLVIKSGIPRGDGMVRIHSCRTTAFHVNRMLRLAFVRSEAAVAEQEAVAVSLRYSRADLAP